MFMDKHHNHTKYNINYFRIKIIICSSKIMRILLPPKTNVINVVRCVVHKYYNIHNKNNRNDVNNACGILYIIRRMLSRVFTIDILLVADVATLLQMFCYCYFSYMVYFHFHMAFA